MRKIQKRLKSPFWDPYDLGEPFWRYQLNPNFSVKFDIDKSAGRQSQSKQMGLHQTRQVASIQQRKQSTKCKDITRMREHLCTLHN